MHHSKYNSQKLEITQASLNRNRLYYVVIIMKLINIAIMYGNYIEKSASWKNNDNEKKADLILLTPCEFAEFWTGSGRGSSSCHKMPSHVFFLRCFWQNWGADRGRGTIIDSSISSSCREVGMQVLANLNYSWSSRLCLTLVKSNSSPVPRLKMSKTSRQVVSKCEVAS